MKQWNSLVTTYRSCDHLTKRAGRFWYPKLNVWLSEMTRQHIYPFENVVVAFAALSPQISFRMNCLGLTELIQTGNTNLGYGQNVAKAKRILMSDRPFEDLATKHPSKCDSFAKAILGNVRAVSLDTWMLHLLGFDGWMTTHRYKGMVQTITKAAIHVGEQPRDFQAILWLATRGSAV